MRRFAIAICGTLLLSACSPSAPTPPPAEPAVDAPAAEPASDTLEMKGIKLYLYASAAVPGQERSPAFSVEAEAFTQDESRTWRFTNAKATVHPKTPEDAPIVFDAGSGQLKEEESALLEGGVTTTIGPMTLNMESVDWQQGEEGTGGMAASHQPVTVLDPTMQLFAQQFRLYPDNANFILYEVHGEVAFTPPQSGEAPPETTDAPADGAPATS